MITLGNFAVYLAVAAGLAALVLGLAGGRRGDEGATRKAEGAIRAAALCLTVAGVVLFAAFVGRDFSVRYVAEYSSRSLPLLYTLAAFWAGQPGSLLLWAWLLSIFGLIVVARNRTTNRDLMPYVVAVMGAAIAFFAFLVAFATNPFERLPFVPTDGQGLNPLLQNYGQMLHPVTLYAGFVGFTVPFAFAIAALATGNLGDRWVRTVRRWTLWSWVLLTAGIVLGARWAYVELGWGGYWGWDPVENASLMPWLAATAYLHSVMIQEKRGMLKVWNVSLVVATFALSIFGTFLTRSGVISSVHAFAQSSIGPLLIGAIAVTLVVSGALIAWRMPELRSKNSFESMISRESSFLLNNLLLVGIAFAIFWGTVYPLVAQAVRGVKVSVGAPFFEAVVTPMAVALLVLTGICPLLAWRRASMRNFRRNFIIPAVSGVAAFVVLVLVGWVVTGTVAHLGASLVLALAVFVTATLWIEFYRGARVRRQTRSEGWGKAFFRLFGRNPRRYGGYLIHLGMVVLLAGIAIHVAYKQEARASVRAGQAVEVGGYRVVMERMRTEETAARFSVIADLSVRSSGGDEIGQLVAMRSVYENQEQPTTEVAIRSSLVEDLYVILQSADPSTGQASLVVLVNPGVFWIWAGALVLLAGGAVVAWPTRRERKGVPDGEPSELEPVGGERS